MRNIPVDTASMLANCMGVMGVQPVVDENGEQRRTDDGVPKWSLYLAIGEQGRKPEICEIKFNAPTAPEVVPGGVPVIQDCRARYWEMGDRSGVSITAAAVGFKAPKAASNGSAEKQPAGASA